MTSTRPAPAEWLGTPTSFAEGRRQYGAYDIDTLTAAVKTAKAQPNLDAPYRPSQVDDKQANAAVLPAWSPERAFRRPTRYRTRRGRVEEDRKHPVHPKSVALDEHAGDDQQSLSRRDRSRRFKIAVAGQYRPVSEAVHGYDERVDIESVCPITRSIVVFVTECAVVEAC
jgi:hypothetical protein